MKINQRCFRNDTDKALMIALARQHAVEHLRVLDLPYRLSSWALDDPENACLWFDEGDNLLGWVVLQSPFWTMDITCRPDVVPTLYCEILAWADARARQVVNTDFRRPSWFVMAFTNQADIIHQLETAGFTCQVDVGEDSWSKVFMHRTGGLPVKDYRIPPGFTVRSLAGEMEVETYVELHRAVFESKNMTVEWRRRTLQHPDHSPDLDVVVAAPDGKLAAFCIGWLHETHGQIEPLGCHANYRHFGLGRVALAEVLRRLQAVGVEHIYVETDNYRDTAMTLYEHMGFEGFRDVWVFRKDYV